MNQESISSKNIKAHHAKKDTSEALEQVLADKGFKWSIKRNSNKSWHNFGSLKRVCPARIDNLKHTKTSKDTYHTRHSKQNTYHVTNKNIVSSKIPIIVGRKQGCNSGESPRLVGWSFLDNSLEFHGIPKIRLLHHSFIHRKITQNLKTSITQNSTKPSWDPLV